MIVDVTRKFILLRNPKAASTSIELTLRQNAVFDEQAMLTEVEWADVAAVNAQGLTAHSVLAEVAGRVGDLSQFAIYGVVRDPVERFWSWVAMLHGPLGRDTDVWALDAAAMYAIAQQELGKAAARIAGNKEGSLGHEPQSTWLMYNGAAISNLYKLESAQTLSDTLHTLCCVPPTPLRRDKAGTRPPHFDRRWFTHADHLRMQEMYALDFQLYSQAIGG